MNIYLVLYFIILSGLLLLHGRQETFKIHVEGNIGMPVFGIKSAIDNIHTVIVEPIITSGSNMIPFKTRYRKIKRFINKM